jgi:hypothetical protein
MAHAPPAPAAPQAAQDLTLLGPPSEEAERKRERVLAMLDVKLGPAVQVGHVVVVCVCMLAVCRVGVVVVVACVCACVRAEGGGGGTSWSLDRAGRARTSCFPGRGATRCLGEGLQSLAAPGTSPLPPRPATEHTASGERRRGRRRSRRRQPVTGHHQHQQAAIREGRGACRTNHTLGCRRPGLAVPLPPTQAQLG